MKSQYFTAEIFRAQCGSEQSMLNLLGRFEPLIRKYAHLLAYEDAYADLRLDFIILIKAFPSGNEFQNDGAVLRYIQKSMCNFFTRIKNKRSKERAVIFFNELSEEQIEIIENGNGELDDYSIIYIDDMKRLLTPREFKVLQRLYVLNLTVAEIACQDGIARQTVNVIKNKSLHKLKASIATQG